MSTTIMAATLCAGVVVAVVLAWHHLGGLLGVDRHPRHRLAHDLSGRALTPPVMWLGAGFVLVGAGMPHPWLVPLFGAVTMQALEVLLRRLVALVVEVARIRAELVGLLIFWTVVLGWSWALTPGRSWSGPLVAAGGVLCLVVMELAFSRSLDVAVRCREIRSTGLRPLVVDDPGWELDQVDVLPDRDSVCVRYVRRPGEGSLWIDLYAVGENELCGGGRLTRVGPALWRVGGESGDEGGWGVVRYLAIAADQVVRLEFDGGRVHDPAAYAVVSRLRPVPPRELAELELRRRR